MLGSEPPEAEGDSVRRRRIKKERNSAKRIGVLE
jgi:hypothetical protein